jgi:hypothetical protein
MGCSARLSGTGIRARRFRAFRLRHHGLVRGTGVFHEEAGAQSPILITLVIYVAVTCVDKVKT